MEIPVSWTEITRRQYRREGLRYASDLTDAEWALIEPLLPSPSRIGRPRTADLRNVVEAILYMASSGCQWRVLGGRSGTSWIRRASKGFFPNARRPPPA